MIINQRLLNDAAQHLDTLAEDIYQKVLLYPSKEKFRNNKRLNDRARMTRIARELREIAKQ